MKNLIKGQRWNYLNTPGIVVEIVTPHDIHGYANCIVVQSNKKSYPIGYRADWVFDTSWEYLDGQDSP